MFATERMRGCNPCNAQDQFNQDYAAGQVEGANSDRQRTAGWSDAVIPGSGRNLGLTGGRDVQSNHMRMSSSTNNNYQTGDQINFDGSQWTYHHDSPGKRGYWGRESGGGGGGSSEGSMGPSVPSLIPYTKPTNVELTRGEREAEGLATRLISGEEGNYRQMLSGTPDYGQLDRLRQISDRRLQENVLPEIRSQLTQGPYGNQFNTGAARATEINAQLAQEEKYAELYYNEYQQAKSDAINAMNQLPNMATVAGISRQNEIGNIMRDLEVHFKNQGLTVQEFGMEMESAKMGLALDQFAYQQYIDAENLKMQIQAQKQQQESGLFGTLGGLAGAAVGFFGGGGPAGAALGYQLGSGIGYSAGGDTVSGVGQIGAGLGSYAQYQLYNQNYNNRSSSYSSWGPWAQGYGTPPINGNSQPNRTTLLPSGSQYDFVNSPNYNPLGE